MKKKIFFIALLSVAAFSSVADPIKKKDNTHTNILECQPFPECISLQEPFIDDGVVVKFPSLFKIKQQSKERTKSLKRKKNAG